MSTRDAIQLSTGLPLSAVLILLILSIVVVGAGMAIGSTLHSIFAKKTKVTENHKQENSTPKAN